MTGTPVVSVIIPIYRRQESGVMAIRSALAQAEAGRGSLEIEIVAVDDGSDPPFSLTEDLVRDGRVQLVRHPENRGAAEARNTGMRTARGEWIALLDSDDRWLPGTLVRRMCIAEAAGDPPSTVRVAAVRYTRMADGVSYVRMPRSSRDPLDFASGCWFSPGSTALFRRIPVIAAAGYQASDLRRLEDVDWFLRLALGGGGIATDPLLAAEINLGKHPAYDTIVTATQTLAAKYPSDGPGTGLPSGLVRRLRAYLALERASAALHEGRHMKTLAELAFSMALMPRARLHVGRFWEPFPDPPTAGQSAIVG